MAYTFINSGADMKWLREDYLPKLPKVFKSALIKGNEDFPDWIEVFEKKDPLVTDRKVRFSPDQEGVFRAVACRQCGGSGKRSTARSASGRELERHERHGTPCDTCRGAGI